MENAAVATADWISELPEGILETILTKLPIRDAVRTCILSKQWRYKWTSLTRLAFNDYCVFPETDNEQVNKAKLVNFITRFLFLHNGPIHKFSLGTTYFNDTSDIDQWLLFISRKPNGCNLLELVLVLGLEQDFYRAPSCIFLFDKLTSLKLARCELNLPPNFKGFPCLKCLYFIDVFISSHGMDCFISSCPVLENLILELYDGLELIIRAPNLKYLDLYGEFKNVCLGNVPVLVDISVVLYAGFFDVNSSCNFRKFLGAVPNLERLSGHNDFTKYLSIGNPDGWKPITYHHLKCIELNEVRFDVAAEVRVVLLLIDSSPNLQDLHISGSSNNITATATEILDTGFSEDVYTLRKLKTVKMTRFSGVPHEIKFIEYLLKSSPDLETMSITTNENVTEGRLNMLVDLVSLPRASPHASIIIRK